MISITTLLLTTHRTLRIREICTKFFIFIKFTQVLFAAVSIYLELAELAAQIKKKIMTFYNFFFLPNLPKASKDGFDNSFLNIESVFSRMTAKGVFKYISRLTAKMRYLFVYCYNNNNIL